jgi:hypothetical protein
MFAKSLPGFQAGQNGVLLVSCESARLWWK